jgi:hypothetical protein
MSPRRWQPSAEMRAKLLRSAGYQCAICLAKFAKFDKGAGRIVYIAEAAHIYPHADGGERGDQARRPALVDDVSNLIMLCPNCHGMADLPGVGSRLFTLDELRAIKRDHEAWVLFKESRELAQRQRPADRPGLSSPSALSGTTRGQSVAVQGQAYRLPWDAHPDRIDSAFDQERSAAGDAVRCQSYAYAETGTARHAWLRQVDAFDGSAPGERWRRELAREASLLKAQLPPLPGLPPVLGAGISRTADRAQVTLVTALPSTVSLRSRYGAASRAVPAEKTVPAEKAVPEESVRALLAGLPALCAALGALHDAGFAHGALDPGAILVDERGQLVLRDLGQATAEPTDKPNGRSKQADVHRLAALVYELVTGVPPLTGPDGPPVPAQVHNPAVSEPAATALAQALAGDIRDARAFARRLQPPGSRNGRKR